MKGIILNFIQGKAKIDVDGEIKDYNIKQSKKNELRSEDIQSGMEVEFEFNTTISKYEVTKVLKKNAIVTKEKIMIVMSTGNQSVNAIPLDVLGIKKVVILSTSFSSAKGYTKNLINFLKMQKIAYYVIDLSREEESDIDILAKKIEAVYLDLNSDTCYLNITGGQKLYVLACSIVKNKLGDNIKTIYLDIHETLMHIDNIKKKYVSKLSLNDILCLYGYTYIKEDAREWTIKDLNHPTLEKINQFSNKYIKEDATSKKFFSLVSNQEMTKFNSINSAFMRILKDMEEAQVTEGITVPLNGIKEQFVNVYSEKINDKSIHTDREKVVLDLIKTVNLTKNQLNEYFGIEKNIDTGNLFEKMLLVKTLEAIKNNEKLKNGIVGVYTSVKTVQNDNTEGAPTESEYDLVITTTKGTLIILEAKTGRYEGDTAKGKEYGAISKSGSYGKSSVIGSLIDRFLNSNGTKKVSYLPGIIENHENVCKNTGIKYIRFDKIEKELEKMI